MRNKAIPTRKATAWKSVYLIQTYSKASNKKYLKILLKISPKTLSLLKKFFKRRNKLKNSNRETKNPKTKFTTNGLLFLTRTTIAKRIKKINKKVGIFL